MEPYLLEPKVITRDVKHLTQSQLMQILRSLKMKKCGIKIYAVDVEEVTTTNSFVIRDKWGNRRQCPPGSYFNLHVEYIL